MSEKLIISSSSFLLPNHPAWNLLGKKFDLDFKYIGNFSGAFLSKNDDEIIVSILFFSDLYDENLPNDVDENKINDPIIELVKRNCYSLVQEIQAKKLLEIYSVILAMITILLAFWMIIREKLGLVSMVFR